MEYTTLALLIDQVILEPKKRAELHELSRTMTADEQTRLVSDLTILLVKPE